MANKLFDNDPIMLKLRDEHPKQGPDPKPGESLEHWAERYMVYIRRKYGLEEKEGK